MSANRSQAGLTRRTALIDMFQLNRGEQPGRRPSPDEITWFKSGGGGHEDLAVAQYLFEKQRWRELKEFGTFSGHSRARYWQLCCYSIIDGWQGDTFVL